MLITSWSQEDGHDSSHHICIQGKEMASIALVIVVLLGRKMIDIYRVFDSSSDKNSYNKNKIDTEH